MNSTRKIHWVFSIFTAAVVYALLLLFFTPAKLDIQPKKDNKKSQITMLPISGNLTSNEKDLKAWMNNENPTLIIQPNRRYNYSRVLANDFKFKINSTSNDFSFLRNVDAIIFKNMKIKKLSLPNASKTETAAKYELYSYPALPAIPYKIPVVNILYPCFRNYYTGEIIPIKFPIPIKITDLVKKYKPETYTLMNIKSTDNIGLFPSVQVIQSCGNEELDKLAVNNVITQATADTNYFNTGKNLKVVVEWQK